jgi:malonyl-CoA O-methyltransferase
MAVTTVATISAIDGHRLWSRAYDESPNALLALEMRVLSERLRHSERLPPLDGLRILDAGSGTGRWMHFARSRGASVFGIDACREMVLWAEHKPGLRGHSALADVQHIPLMDDAFDVALCSFTLGYLQSPGPVLRELARVARQVIVSDLHPDAARAGWTRSFRVGDQVHELVHFKHSIADIDDAARGASLVSDWRVEASFGEPEREIFQRTGKENVFDHACAVSAVLITSWHRQSD